MAQTTVEVLHRTTLDPASDPKTGKPRWQLFYMFARWHYGHEAGYTETGTRFMWKRDDGRWQPARGQARLPGAEHIRALLAQADSEGWGHLTDEDSTTRIDASIVNCRCELHAARDGVTP
jgi:hypothetical protein